MNPLQELNANVTPSKRKVSHVVAAQCKKTQRWRLRATYHPCKHAKSQRKQTGHRYKTRQEALDDAERWTAELERPRRGGVSPASSEFGRRPRFVRPDCCIFDQHLRSCGAYRNMKAAQQNMCHSNATLVHTCEHRGRRRWTCCRAVMRAIIHTSDALCCCDFVLSPALQQ